MVGGFPAGSGLGVAGKEDDGGLAEEYARNAGHLWRLGCGLNFLRDTDNLLVLSAGLTLVLGGALGNLVDRIRLGYVVDFIRFHLNDRCAYPTFNIADAWITIGVILIIVDGFIDGKQGRDGASKKPPAPGVVDSS